MPSPANNASALDALSGHLVVLGSAGMLGQAWCQLLNHLHITHQRMDHSQFDLTDLASISTHITDQTRLVVNSAAYTDVDQSEQDEDQARQVNGTAVGYLAERCRQIGATLIHYSTDYVFNGLAEEPYPTDAPQDPINAYGRTKLLGENAIWKSGCDHLLIRTSWIYAAWGQNFVRTIMRKMNESKQIKVVNDQWGRPTSAPHLAHTSLMLYASAHRGTFHVCDGGQCTWYEFAEEIARQIGAKCIIRPSGSDEFSRPAKRPAYSVLDLTETEKVVGKMPDWKSNLAAVLQSMESSRDQRRG